MLYEYSCDFCGRSTTRQSRADITICHSCGQPARRIWAFRLQSSPDQEHYNVSAGRWVSNRRQLIDHAKRQSDLATQRTGIPHDFVPIDHADKAALGVTEEGAETIARHHSPSYVKPLES
jgi:hypothetical protein